MINDNYTLIKKLGSLGFSEDHIYEIIIRKNTSPLIKDFIERIENNESFKLEDMLLDYFLMADKMKPITCNKNTLSILTGLSTRQIDERRRARQIPSIQLTGQSGAGRKIILYNPDEFKDMILAPKYKVHKATA
ncbi:MAG: hypothetical protein DRG78_05700 [Epsilonproteobacteria bacterium]|nr:MAG: hypothetical protein DRG78_05700 [Campylobacterota bacterium]